MKCRILGCTHKIINFGLDHVSKSWILYQICPCCFYECIDMGIFVRPVWFRYGTKCLRELKVEGYKGFPL